MLAIANDISLSIDVHANREGSQIKLRESLIEVNFVRPELCLSYAWIEFRSIL